MHAIPIERIKYTRFPPTGVTGTWPELPERALNIICISLKFLHTSAWNPTILTILFQDTAASLVMTVSARYTIGQPGSYPDVQLLNTLRNWTELHDVDNDAH